ncbi:protein D3-like isoform X2 [Aphis craccivora]|uniref:Protein D3-like isoform X2 n=1 Tax=Aphis craccivora TaxID=307492 RepID=A0A6G0Z807_APHCR|nr:protein D3-like isoform X2 [Aphis craccivora]
MIGVSSNSCNINQSMENQQVVTDVIIATPKEIVQEKHSEYVGSGPPQKAGRSVEHREKFLINKFALKYNLGTPVAGNFYLAQYDDYVPTLCQLLGIN